VFWPTESNPAANFALVVGFYEELVDAPEWEDGGRFDIDDPRVESLAVREIP